VCSSDLGWFLREFLDRRSGRFISLNRYRKQLEQTTADSVNIVDLDISLERLLQKNELKRIMSLDLIRFVIRVGPALGLMGTLIPMGISLAAMAQGDMPKMAGSMVTAFTTVIIGLACSVLAYLMSLVKEKWVRADMREMEYLTELALRDSRVERRCRKEKQKEEDK
jgi:biopolymer transport protein ExbB/TolQ